MFSFMKKSVLYSLITIGLIGFASAVWIFSYHSNISSFAIFSEAPLVFNSDEFENSGVQDVNNDSWTKKEYLNITNNDGTISLYFTLNQTIEDVNDECIISEDDFNVYVLYSETGQDILTNGQLITIPSGESYLTLWTNVSRYACPSAIQNQIILEQI